ncbi:MAG: serine/threonine-protein phosphatase [Verrucomicrobia bacterium]|nr:serine/threonine-protein phosphatase [Verrucomicrobiota bacterium]
MPSPALLRWSALTHSGSRKLRNDDSFIAFASSPKGAETLPAEGIRSLANHDLVFAVSDGMGGGNAGDLASSLILQRMSEIIPETFKAAAAGMFPDCLSHLDDAIRSVHEHINAEAKLPEHKGMAATLALAWFTPENLYLTNVGDSRIYRSSGGQLTQLTRDHTAAWGQWKRGEITEFQFRTHPRRSALYEVVGGGHQNVCPHFAAIPYLPGDRFLICSDGLIDGVWERHISDALAKTAPDPSDTTRSLARRAIENSGIDDTTLIIVTISPD